MNHRFPEKRDGLFGWLSDLGDEEWIPKGVFKDHSSLSVYEENSHVCVEAALPGLKPEDIDVSYEKGVLWIRGRKKEEEEDKQKKYYRKASSEFSYSVHVPGNIDERVEPEATFKHGVMKVAFKKVEKTEPKKIKVKGF
jgi:HSP20 family protein